MSSWPPEYPKVPTDSFKNNNSKQSMPLLFLSFLFSGSQESFSDVDSLWGVLHLDCLQQVEEIHPRIPQSLAPKTKPGTHALNFAGLLNIPNE